MGNNIVSMMAGIGNIHMRMFDGHVRAITNVCHIPNLRKSLLSLGALEAQECKFLGAHRGIKVTKGSMMILKGE